MKYREYKEYTPVSTAMEIKQTGTRQFVKNAKNSNNRKNAKEGIHDVLNRDVNYTDRNAPILENSGKRNVGEFLK